jgi:fructose-1,6-bisphosphatase I
LSQHLRGTDIELRRLIYAFSYIALDAQHEFPKYLRGAAKDRNKYGEAVARLDEWVSGFLCDEFMKTGLVRRIHSEELEKPLEGNPKAPFVVTMDPVDGSSNIITNNPFGSIIGIYREDLPQKGRKLAAAIYKLYGPVNTLVYSVGNGTHEFVKHYDGEGNAQFYLIEGNMKMPSKGEVFGIGGDPVDWDPKLQKFAVGLFMTEKMKVRYSGTFVADVSQILHRGGLFAYAPTKKNSEGKLRLMYEANPMALLVEQAGGVSWNGRGSILDADGHEDSRTPVYLGSKELVGKLKKALM